MINSYDELYRQIDMVSKPFGYSVEYFMWRTSKLKNEMSKFVEKDGLMLDVGGGFGVMARFLPDFVDKENRYINLDISSEMLKYSPHQNILAATEYIPFCDVSFDYVFMSDVLEHVRDKMVALKESYRVLKLGGLLLLTTPRTGWIKDFKKSYFIVFLIADWVIGSIRRKLVSKKPRYSVPKGVIDEPSDEEWLRETLERIGFAVLKQYRADNHVPWGNAGESKFWRWFADKCIDPLRFGHCTVVVCTK